MLMVNQKETGLRIYKMMAEKGITPRDVKETCHLASVHAVYKWYWGKSIPSIDNLVILAWMLDVTIDDIIVVEGKDG